MKLTSPVIGVFEAPAPNPEVPNEFKHLLDGKIVGFKDLEGGLNSPYSGHPYISGGMNIPEEITEPKVGDLVQMAADMGAEKTMYRLASSAGGNGYNTASEKFGQTINYTYPSREYTGGGSSGGSASAVAVGLVHIASASDGGGSIRFPAAINGLVGHKPGCGENKAITPTSHDWQIPGFATGFAEAGFIATTPHETALMNDYLRAYSKAMSRPDKYPERGTDPTYRFAEYTGRDEHTVPRQRIALIDGIFSSIAGQDSHNKHAIQTSADRLADLGHEIIDLRGKEMPWVENSVSIAAAFVTMVTIIGYNELKEFERMHNITLPRDTMDPVTKVVSYLGEAFQGQFNEKRKTLLDFLTKSAMFYETNMYDAVLQPTLPHPLIRTSEVESTVESANSTVSISHSDLRSPEFEQILGGYVMDTGFANLAGLPSTSTPVEFTQVTDPINGKKLIVPVSVMMTGATGSDNRLLGMSEALLVPNHMPGLRNAQRVNADTLAN